MNEFIAMVEYKTGVSLMVCNRDTTSCTKPLIYSYSEFKFCLCHDVNLEMYGVQSVHNCVIFIKM